MLQLITFFQSRLVRDEHGATAVEYGLMVALIAVVALIGRVLRRGARLVGLSWADRIGGAALGTVEGVVIAMVVVLGASWIVGIERFGLGQTRDGGNPLLVADQSLDVGEDLGGFVIAPFDVAFQLVGFRISFAGDVEDSPARCQGAVLDTPAGLGQPIAP